MAAFSSKNRVLQSSTMFLLIPMLIPKLIGWSFLLWILLSTVIPQGTMKFTNPEVSTSSFAKPTYPYNSITSPTPLPIRNSTVYFIIGHPDDEVMFFSPSVVEMAKKKHNNHVKLVCFSRGDAVDESMGVIRTEELHNSARILGVDASDVIVLEKFKDGMDQHWEESEIRGALAEITNINQQKKKKQKQSPQNTVFITFDQFGVSKHPNHIALYHGTRSFFENDFKPFAKNQHNTSRLYVLKSLNFWEKYLFTLLTNVELFVDLLSRFVLSNLLKVNVNVSFFDQSVQKNCSSVRIYSDLNMLSLSYAAMAYGHFSQMVWFRYGWLVFSRYLAFNNLMQIGSSN